MKPLRLLVLWLLAWGLVVGLAYAQSQCFQYTGSFGSVSGTGGSPQAAAQAAVDAANASVAGCTSSTVYGGVTYSTCAHYTLTSYTTSSFVVNNCSAYCSRLGAAGTNYNGTITATPVSCPINNCTKISGQSYAMRYASPAGVTTPPRGQPICDMSFTGGSGDPNQGGCEIDYTADYSYMLNGAMQSTGAAKASGAKCSMNGTTPMTTTTEPPAPGQATQDPPSSPCQGFMGSVNGVPYCAPAVGPNGVDSTVHTNTATSTVTQTNPDGSTSTVSTSNNTTTNCAKDASGAVQCTQTVVTTTVNGTGTTSTTQTTTAALSDYCKANPTDKLCQAAAQDSFSGQCGSPPICNGDAVQCAVAAATYQSNCALNPSDSGGDQAKFNQAKNAPINLGTTTVSLSSSSFDTSDALGGSTAGLQDLQVTVWNNPVTIKLSVLNDWLALLGNVLVSVAFVIAAIIVGKGSN
jgi:hypothetical protein